MQQALHREGRTTVGALAQAKSFEPHLPPSPGADEESERRALASELESPFFSPEEAALYLRLDAGDGSRGARTLAVWRSQGRGPRFRAHGRKVVYHRAALDAWSQQQERSSTLKERGA